MSIKFAQTRRRRKQHASEFVFHAAEVSETARTTGLLLPHEQQAWAMARAAQLADYERRRAADVLTLPAPRVPADERLLQRWNALQAAIREAA